MADERQVELLRSTTDIVALVAVRVKLTKKGDKYWGCCPFHNESTPSFTVDNNGHSYHCFGCGKHGDAFDWLQEMQGMTFLQAVEALSNGHAKPLQPAKAKKEKPAAISPVPADAPPPSTDHPKHGAPSTVWTYRNASGDALSIVARFDTATGKEVLPLVYTASGWRWQGLPKPRPIYNLDKLAVFSEAPVLVVEGEKCAVAAEQLYPDYVSTTWQGGAQAFKYADWKPLQGRAVTIWPDADEPGLKAAKDIKKLLGGRAKILTPPPGAVSGWDAADMLAEAWTPERKEAFLLAPAAPDAIDPTQPIVAATEADVVDEAPFSLLGHDHGRYFFFPRATGQVVDLPGQALSSPSSLLMLAPLAYWQNAHGAKGREGWPEAANALMRGCERLGVYDPNKLRGTGAWWDDGRAILHLGDHLVVDGVPIAISTLETKYIYERAAAIRFGDPEAEPLKSNEAVKLYDLCKLLYWERSVSAAMLAGWIVVAPICGALRWRPHIFLTGQSGAGKTWVYENIVIKSLGGIAAALASSVTEPGIRWTLKSSAIPCVIDEIEARNQFDRTRLDSILNLLRYASSDTSAIIAKGHIGGGIDTFRVRTCAAFSAIGTNITELADQSRFTILNLRRNDGIDRAAHFRSVRDAQAMTLTRSFIDRLHSRIVRLIPVIRDNIETFAAAGSEALGTQRLGDQIGTLAAGCFALHSSERVTPRAAAAWIDKQDWSDERAIADSNDGADCLYFLLEKIISVQGKRQRLDRSLGELVHQVIAYQSTEELELDVAKDTLRRHGMLVDGGELVIGNTHSAIATILKDTSWSRNWHHHLRTIPGAHPVEKLMKFYGETQRATAVVIKS